MKLNCSRAALENALGIITGVVTTRTPRETLKCAEFVAKGEEVTLAGTDLEVSVRCAISQVEVEQEGRVLLPAGKLSQIVHELTDEAVGFEQTDETVHIRGQGSHFQIYGQDPAEFPPIPGFEGEAEVLIASGVLRRLIERTVFAAARENTRYAISGVLWEGSGKKLQLVATDGRRLAKAVGSAKQAIKGGFSAIVPAKTMSLLLRVIQGDGSEQVALKVAGNQVVAQAGPVTVASVLVEGHFPKYDDVIPRDIEATVTFNTAELHGAIRRAALLTSDESKGIRADFSQGGLVLSSRTAKEGEATIDMKVAYDGSPMAIGFNPGFLTDALRVVEAEQVDLNLSGADKPGVLTAGKEFVYVVMPVSLS